MTLPYLGEKPVDNPLTQISANIKTILNPNWQMQLEMQRKLMSDPTYATQLAEVERNAPGTMAKLGFGKKLTEVVQKIPESDESINRKQLQQLQIQDAKNNLEQFGMVKKKFEDEQADREKQLKGIEAFKKFNIAKETEDFIAGKPSNEFLKALSTAGNENQQVFGMYTQNLSQMRRLDQEHALAMARINHEQGLINAREDKSFQRALLSNAIDSYQKTGVGSVATWKTLLDPSGSGAERMQALMKNPLLAKTTEDRNLLAIGQHTQASQDAAVAAQKSSLLVKARQSLSAAQNPNLKREEVAPYVQQANEMYNGIRQIDPKFNVSVRQKDKDIQLVDENTGTPVDDENALINVDALPHAKGKTVRQTLDEAVQAWRNAPTFGKDNKSSIATRFKSKYGNDMFKLFWKRRDE
jgi:hypothetical protein